MISSNTYEFIFYKKYRNSIIDKFEVFLAIKYSFIISILKKSFFRILCIHYGEQYIKRIHAKLDLYSKESNEHFHVYFYFPKLFFNEKKLQQTGTIENKIGERQRQFKRAIVFYKNNDLLFSKHFFHIRDIHTK